MALQHQQQSHLYMEALSAHIHAENKVNINIEYDDMALNTTQDSDIVQQEQLSAVQGSCHDRSKHSKEMPITAQGNEQLLQPPKRAAVSPGCSPAPAYVSTPVQEEAPFLGSGCAGSQVHSPAPITDDGHEAEQLLPCSPAITDTLEAVRQQAGGSLPASDSIDARPASGSQTHSAADTLDSDVAAAMSLVLLHTQPSSSVLCIEDPYHHHEAPVLVAPDSKRYKQMHNYNSYSSRQQLESATSASAMHGCTRLHRTVKQHKLASAAASPNKLRAALERVQAAKQVRKQGCRLTYGPNSLGSIGRSTMAQDRSQYQPQELLSAGTTRQPSKQAEAAVAAVQTAALQADTAKQLLDKVSSAFWQLSGSTEAASEGQTAPELMLAAAAGPWYPTGGAMAPFLVKRQGRMVPRTMFDINSAAAAMDDGGAATLHTPGSSKQQAISLLQVVQQRVQQYRASETAVTTNHANVASRQAVVPHSSLESPIKQVTDAHTEEEMQLKQQRQQPAADNKNLQHSPSTTAEHCMEPHNDCKQDGSQMQGAAAALVQAAQAAQAGNEAERRLQPRRKRKMPAKLDDTLSTECALQIISGRGPRSSQQYVSQSAAGASAPGSWGSNKQQDVLQLLTEQLTSASEGMQQAAEAAQLRKSANARRADAGAPHQQRLGWQQHAWWAGNQLTQRQIHKQWWAWAEQEQQKLEQQEMEELLARYAQPQLNTCNGIDSVNQQKPLEPSAMGLAVWSCVARQPEAATATAAAAVQKGAPAAVEQLRSMAVAVQQAAATCPAAKNPALAPFLLPCRALGDCQNMLAGKIQERQGARLAIRDAFAATVTAAKSFSKDQQTAGAANSAADASATAEDVAGIAVKSAAQQVKKPKGSATASGRKLPTDGVNTSAAGTHAAKAPPPLNIASQSRADLIAAKRARLQEQLQAACDTPKPVNAPANSSRHTPEPMMMTSQEVVQQCSSASARESSPDVMLVELQDGHQEHSDASVLPESPTAEAVMPVIHSGPRRKQSQKARKPRGPVPMLKNQQQLEELIIQQHNQQRIGDILQKAQQQQEQKQQVQELLDKVAEQRQQRLQQVRMQQHQARVQALMQRIVAQQQQPQQQQKQKPQKQQRTGSPDAPADKQQSNLVKVVLQQNQPEHQPYQTSPQGAPQQVQCLPGATTLKLQPCQPGKMLQSTPRDGSCNQQQQVVIAEPAYQPQTAAAGDAQQQQQHTCTPTAQRPLNKPVINLSASTTVAAKGSRKVQQRQQALVKPPVPVLHAQTTADQPASLVSAPMQQHQLIKPTQQKASLTCIPVQQQQAAQQTQANPQLHVLRESVLLGQPVQVDKAAQQQVLQGVPVGHVNQLGAGSLQPQVVSTHLAPQVRPSALAPGAVAQAQSAVSTPAPAVQVVAAPAPSLRPVQSTIMQAAAAAAAKPPGVTSQSAAVAASRARLLAALGGDDDAPTPAPAITASTAVQQRSMAPGASVVVSNGPTSAICSMAPAASVPLSMTAAMRPPTAVMPLQPHATVATGNRGLMYVPMMPVAFVPATAALLQGLPARHQYLMPGTVPTAPMMVAAEPSYVQK